MYAKFSRPICETESDAVMSQPPIAAHVAFLLFWQGPDTVIRRIIPCIIFAFQGMARRRFLSHIRKKFRKGYSPLLTHGDATPAIVIKSAIVVVVTALNHAIPRSILRASLPCTAMAMLGKKCARYFLMQIPTTLHVSTKQLICTYLMHSPTITAAGPIGTRNVATSSCDVSSKTDNNQPAKPLPGQIFRLLMKYGSILLRHARLLVSRVVFRGTALLHQCCFPVIIALFLVMFPLVPHTVYAQSVQSSPEPEPHVMQQCTDQLLAAQQHVMLIVQRRNRDEQTISELVVRIQRLQQEIEGLKKNAPKVPSAS